MTNEQTGENDGGSEVRSAEAQSELQEYFAVSRQRRRVLPRAALVGFGAGLTSAIFRALLSSLDSLRDALIAWAHQFPWLGWVLPVLFTAAGAVASAVIVRRYAPETSGSGVPHLKGVLRGFRTLSWKRVLPVKFIAGTLAIGGGLVLGREGPTVQMGGSIGDLVAGWLRSPGRERRTLIAAGAGAGLAAAFNAPLAGLMFVLEEVQRDFHPIVFGASFLAAAMADIVVRLVLGSSPVFLIPNYPAPPLSSMPAFALLGILAGFLGVAFNRGLLGTLDLFSRFQKRSVWQVAAVVGGAIGLVSWFAPSGIGGGHSLAESILAGQFILAAIPLWFVLRFLMTITSYGTGAAGGIFAPLLVLGALLGLLVGQIFHAVLPEVAPVAAVFAVVGMAAYFTAIVRAPLTGIVLIVEMTGNYNQMLALLVCCFFAYAIPELLKDLPIYEALLERDLREDKSAMSLKEPMVIDFEIEPDSPYEGQEIRMLGLPAGCVLIRITQDGNESVPTATTKLVAHMRITALISPEAARSLDTLRRGVTTRRATDSHLADDYDQR